MRDGHTPPGTLEDLQPARLLAGDGYQLTRRLTCPCRPGVDVEVIRPAALFGRPCPSKTLVDGWLKLALFSRLKTSARTEIRKSSDTARSGKFLMTDRST